ncbi:OmpP1/FadL family transporter [Polluticoccus soli]|uniref:OmpP1/FadL family transporter n=1 Tax=Polluticoccus soli TaxID=3034150 RepID=UPI0023E32EAF|nr:hypothetical protein [Flavipsychrobacter sp. JY13-12]
MNNRLLSFLLVLSGVSGFYTVSAQDETDALRYSFLQPMGTARSMGLGGAMGSVGGDFTSLSINPAGIGVYRNSEFMITPSLKINNIDGLYQGQTMSENNTRFNFNNIGAVFTRTPRGKRYDCAKWRAVSFGIGMNRLADFNRNVIYGGRNTQSSFSEIFVADAANFDVINNTQDLQDLSTLSGIGWQSFLMDTIGGKFFTTVPFTTGVLQQRALRERGGVNEIAISFGGNYKEQLMLGATLGLPAVNYNRTMVFDEVDATNDPNNNFSSLSFAEDLSSSALGINLKLGFIYKPSDKFRIGGALHTPTYLGFSDVQNRSIVTNTEAFGGKQTLAAINDIPEQIFDYGLTTPWRGIVSATGFLGKHGFITADYEYVDYASARYHFDGAFVNSESFINQLIRQRYRGASNFRIGAEGRFDQLMVRLGFGYYGNPEKNGGDDRMSISAGVGYRFDNWFVDLGFMNTQYQEHELPYQAKYPENYYPDLPSGIIPIPQAAIKNSLNNVALTLGWKF